MRSVNHIRSFVIFVVVFLLLSSTVINACYAEQLPHSICAKLLAKKHTSHSQSVTVTPYEERQNEEENGPEKSRQLLFIICDVSVSSQPAPLPALYSLHTVSRSCGYAFAVPVFLAKKSLLI
jgi:hypothetical protein